MAFAAVLPQDRHHLMGEVDRRRPEGGRQEETGEQRTTHRRENLGDEHDRGGRRGLDRLLGVGELAVTADLVGVEGAGLLAGAERASVRRR
jgi:hypothetical protein